MRFDLILAAVTATGLGLAGPAVAEMAAASTETPAAAAPALPAITVSAAAARPMRDTVLASGLVGPVEEVYVAPLIEGQPIEVLMADVGDRVEAGQVLARLSDSTLVLQKSQAEASLASAKASIAQAEAQLVNSQAQADEAQRVADRTAKLKAQGTYSTAQADSAQAAAISANAAVQVAAQALEAAKAQQALAEAQLDNVNLQLARTEVKAPVAGEVVQRNALVGGIATAAGSPMFVLIRDGALELKADVAERDLLRLKAGQRAEMRSVSASGPLTGTVRLVEPAIDTTSRLGRVRITVDQAEMIRSGMFLDAEILVEARRALAVPVTAVGSGVAGATAMKITDGLASKTAVTTGIRDGGYIEIVSGLAEGDLVVTKAGAFVRDGDRVNPVPAPAAAN